VIDVPSLPVDTTHFITVTGLLASNLATIDYITTTALLTTTFPVPASDHTLVHTVDNLPPLVRGSRNPGGAIPGGPQIITGEAEDGPGSGVAYVEVSVDGSIWQLAEGTQSWSTAVTPTTMLEGGDVTMYVRATDYHGQTSPVELITYTVDAVAPLITPTVPVVVGNATAAAISGTTQDPAPAGAEVQEVAVQFDVDTAVWQPATVNPPVGSGEQGWNYGWLLPSEDWITHTVRFRATDYGNNVATTGWYNIVVDTVAPTVTVTQQLMQVVQGSDISVLAGLASDGGSVDTATVAIYPTSGAPISETVAIANGQWSYVLNQPPGEYTLWLTVVDTVGNGRLVGETRKFREQGLCSLVKEVNTSSPVLNRSMLKGNCSYP
jgi:hypothetical protein